MGEKHAFNLRQSLLEVLILVKHLSVFLTVHASAFALPPRVGVGVADPEEEILGSGWARGLPFIRKILLCLRRLLIPGRRPLSSRPTSAPRFNPPSSSHPSASFHY